MPATIAACSSGSMPCGVALVRLSGPEAFSVLDQVFLPKNQQPAARWTPRTMRFGQVIAKDGRTLDLCLAAVFPGPNSYTGEDLAEIYCHGSQPVVAGLLDHCFAQGAIPAPPGEFTKRAFLSGRMDLTEAEAVADLIHAQSELGAKAAAAQLTGSVGGRVKTIREELLALLAHFYAVCDYSDEALEPFDYPNAIAVLTASKSQLTQLYQGFQRGRLVREGVPVAIIGRPNAGKSSLFNALAGQERAIVTEEAGTTRDVLEQVISCDGAPVRILDTAGLRNSQSKAEQKGVELARQAAQQAQTVLCVIDRSVSLTQEDQDALSLARQCPLAVLVLNKADLSPNPAPWEDALRKSHSWAAVFPLSAKEGTVEPLSRWLAGLAPHPEETLVTSARQAGLLEQAVSALEDAISSASQSMTADAFLLDAERAVNLLGQVTGETASADLAHEIFSRFCVGK